LETRGPEIVAGAGGFGLSFGCLHDDKVNGAGQSHHNRADGTHFAHLAEQFQADVAGV